MLEFGYGRVDNLAWEERRGEEGKRLPKRAREVEMK